MKSLLDYQWNENSEYGDSSLLKCLYSKARKTKITRVCGKVKAYGKFKFTAWFLRVHSRFDLLTIKSSRRKKNHYESPVELRHFLTPPLTTTLSRLACKLNSLVYSLLSIGQQSNNLLLHLLLSLLAIYPPHLLFCYLIYDISSLTESVLGSIQIFLSHQVISSNGVSIEICHFDFFSLDFVRFKDSHSFILNISLIDNLLIIYNFLSKI